jgi:hypothetical protein
MGVQRQTMIAEMIEMGIDPMAEIRALGYEYRQGQLRQVDGNGAFVWQGQSHYESMADAVAQYVPLLLEEEARLTPLWLPLGVSPGEGCPIFASEGYDKAERLLLIIQGMGKVRAGVWGCSLCINNSLEEGTMLPYLRRAKASGYGVVVFNPNENTVDGVPVPGSENFGNHVKYVMDKVVSCCSAAKIDIVAHSHGGRALMSYLATAGGDNCATTLVKRINRLVFTDSYHMQTQLAYLPSAVKSLLSDPSRAVNFVPDTSPLGTHVEEWASQEYAFSEVQKGCLCLSAGVLDHASTNYAAMGAIFEFLEAGNCDATPGLNHYLDVTSNTSSESGSLSSKLDNRNNDDNPVMEFNPVVEVDFNNNADQIIVVKSSKAKKSGHWSKFKSLLYSNVPMKVTNRVVQL